MIQLENLTAKQHQMVDTIWSFESQDQYMDWYSELTEPDRQQALVLMRLLSYEVLERRVDEFRDLAGQILAEFRL